MGGYLTVFFLQIFLNDYMKHIVETKLQINGEKKKNPKISAILTYFHNLTLRLLFSEGQTFKMSVDMFTKKS